MFFLILEYFRSLHSFRSVGLGDPSSSSASIVSFMFSFPFLLWVSDLLTVLPSHKLTFVSLQLVLLPGVYILWGLLVLCCQHFLCVPLHLLFYLPHHFQGCLSGP